MSKLLTVLALVLIPFATSFHLNANDENSDNKPLDLDKLSNTSQITVEWLNQFSVFDRLGCGGFASVYLVRKNGGSDDGQLYALKVINIRHALTLEAVYKSRSLNIEREILEMAREWPWATGLHYAFHDEGNVFLVIDFASGGSLLSKLKQLKGRPDANTAKLILAETVSIVEQLHANGFLHLDVQSVNLLIESSGHLSIADFGIAKRLKHNHETARDWRFLEGLGRQLLHYPLSNDHEKSIQKMFRNMTDTELPELKNNPYFNGIDWEKVAARESDPPFEPIEFFELDEDKRIDLAAKLQGTIDDELDEAILERLYDYAFVAPELQHSLN